jgi:hypothetical protein
MNESYSNQEVEQYLAKVNADIEKGRIDPDTFANDFSFHQALIQDVALDLKNEKLILEVSCVDWLKENSGTANPYLPHKLVFHDMVQFYYKNREERKEPRIFDLKAMTLSNLLMESKDLYVHREEAGYKPIALDIQMPLEDSECIVLCSELEVHIGDRMVMVGP